MYTPTHIICIVLTVFTPTQSTCTSPLTVKATARRQHLSSVVSTETSCGLHQTPYVLEAQPGQTITITLIDFKEPTDNTDCVSNVGYIMDTKHDDVIHLCAGSRLKTHYVSVSNKVQVLLERSAVENNYFLIEFQGNNLKCLICTQEVLYHHLSHPYNL